MSTGSCNSSKIHVDFWRTFRTDEFINDLLIVGKSDIVWNEWDFGGMKQSMFECDHAVVN